MNSLVTSATDLPKPLISTRHLLHSFPDWKPDQGVPEGLLDTTDDNKTRWLFSTENPWFDEGSCLIILGFRFRLIVFMHPQVRFETASDQPAAWFGFWKTDNDVKINRQAFLIAEQWAKRHGAKMIYGPVNFNSFGHYRLRTSDFASPAFPGEPENPDYFLDLIQQFGYQQTLGFFSQQAELPQQLKSQQISRLHSLRQKLHQRFQLSTLTPQVWLERSAEFHKITDMVFSQNPAYQKVTAESFYQLISKPLANKFCQFTSMMITEKSSNKICAVYLVFPDWSGLNSASNPQTDQSQNNYEIDFVRDFKKLHYPQAIIKTAGTLEQYQGLGLMSWMNLSAAKIMYQYYRSVIGALISDGNPSAKLVPQITGSEIRERTYGLYCKAL